MSLMKPILVPLRLGRYTFTRARGQLSNGMLTLHGHIAVEVLLRAEAGEQFFWLGKFLCSGHLIFMKRKKLLNIQVEIHLPQHLKSLSHIRGRVTRARFI